MTKQGSSQGRAQGDNEQGTNDYKFKPTGIQFVGLTIFLA